MNRRTLHLISAAFLLALILIPSAIFADTHNIAVASDLHDNKSAISRAMGQMPSDLEYVSLIGDMTGGAANMQPEFDTSSVFGQVSSLFPALKARDGFSILWADHDANGRDDAGVLFAKGGSGSGLMKTGRNADGSVAYYIYGIAFFDMVPNVEDYAALGLHGGNRYSVPPGPKDTARFKAATKAFTDWIDTVEDKTIPIFVFCHIPLHYARCDNPGALYWNRALNYAAAGTEEPAKGTPAERNVFYFHGHNHTYETAHHNAGNVYSGEFYVPSGASMKIGQDKNTMHPICYTYTTAGYLNANAAATLITITDDKITISKYKNGVVTDLYDKRSQASGAFASQFLTKGVNETARVSAYDLRNADISGIEESYVYTGKAVAPVPVVKVNGKTLTPGKSYKVTYSNNRSHGSASVSISGMRGYCGTAARTFKITKALNTMKVKPRTVTLKWSKLKRASQTIKNSEALTLKNPCGKVTYKLTEVSKKSFKKYFKVSQNTGKLTVRKGLKKGTYRVGIKVTASGNARYMKMSKTVKVKVIVR